MKVITEVEMRVRELLLEELQRRLARQKVPIACVHNHRHPLDHRKTVYDEPNTTYNRITQGLEEVEGVRVALPVLQTVGLCMLGAASIDSWPGNICEEALDAQRCPDFQYKATRAELYAAFVAEVSDPAWVEAALPAVHSLLWVLGASMQVRRESALDRAWTWLRQIFAGAKTDSPDVLVYLPAPDACSDQDRAGAPTSN